MKYLLSLLLLIPAVAIAQDNGPQTLLAKDRAERAAGFRFVAVHQKVWYTPSTKLRPAAGV